MGFEFTSPTREGGKPEFTFRPSKKTARRPDPGDTGENERQYHESKGPAKPEKYGVKRP